MPASETLIFLHIPKTAGTTVHHILHAQYKGKNMFSTENPGQISNYKILSEEQKKQLSIIKGHFPYGIHYEHPLPAAYFTFLRDPIKRSISAFNYLYEHKAHFFHAEIMRNQYTLKQMLKDGHMKIFDNCQVRYLADALDLEYGAVDESVYQRALHNLENGIRVTGICERFDESIVLIRDEFGWNEPFYIMENVSISTHRKNEFDEETMGLLHQFNKYDLLLYEYATKRFEDTISSKGPQFQAEVNTFKRKNSLQTPFRKLFRKLWMMLQKLSGN
ncbi:MAG: sulfotransferase family protein [Bacteroidota bacterium]|nr:sulfotransferase family protein [Bacteroidota bacterium]